MKRLFLILFGLPFFGFSQNTIGFPEVINYSKSTYKGGLQNWDIKQAANGMIYVANNEGMLSFDGVYWTLYPLPNKTNVRSVETGADNHIYAGGQDELGYFAPAANGRLTYTSLVHLIDQKHRSFGDVWDIVSSEKALFFRTQTKIFRYNGKSITVYPAPSQWSYLGKSNNKLFAHDYERGLCVWDNNSWQPVASVNTLSTTDPVTSILDFENGASFITTLKNGLYLLSDSSITNIPSPNNELFKKQRIYAAVKINEQRLALATNNGGVYMIDTKGSIIQQFSKTEGLHNNNVLSVFSDKQQNVWLGLDNGIDFIAFNSAIKQIKPMMEEASGYTLLMQGQQLYAGTSSGLYKVLLSSTDDLSFSKGNFEQIHHTKGQVWNLTEVNNALLMGHHEGAFVIKNNHAVPLSTEQGFWNFIPLSTGYPVQELVAGHYNGIQFFKYDGSNFIPATRIEGFAESSRFIVAENQTLWISHPYHGVFRIEKKADGSHHVYTYDEKKGLPSTLNNHAHKIKNELLVVTEKGIYNYNKSKDLFEASPFYATLLGSQSVRYLKEDKNGNIWFIHEKTLGVIDMTKPQPKIFYLPELNSKMLSGFELIYPLDDKNIFMGGEKGFYHINFEKYKRSATALDVQVRKVVISHVKDSLLFGGYFADVNAEQQQQPSQIPVIAYSWKTIQFEYSSSLFGSQSNLEYSYRLIGFTNSWSEWSHRTEKEYTNLNAGTYRFEVKVRNNLGNESNAAVYEFKLLPPFYKAWWAKTLYAVFIICLVYYLYRRHLKKLDAQQQIFVEEQRKLKYIHELERSKTESELVTLQNEKLEAEINYKNSEVAAAAMHLVKKGELLGKIKADLALMMKRVDNEQAVSEIKKMIKSLSEEEHMDEEWDNFTKHFDKVNSDFVVRLKQVHPNLTGNELKLCTYLRMNLSTKEIAQLMNISVRGVEISRYRLRKKLGISSSVSLFDYLLEIKKVTE